MVTMRFCNGKHHHGPRWLSWVDFYVKVWGDETKTWPAQLQSSCKGCQTRASRERKAVSAGRDPSASRPRGGRKTPAEVARRNRERYAERMQDPEFREARREYSREMAAVRRRRAGAKPRRAYKKLNEGKPVRVDVGPLWDWLHDTGMWFELSEAEREMWRGRHRRGTGVSLDEVDVVLTAAERPDLLFVLYGGDGCGR